jgi:hypothetical protein
MEYHIEEFTEDNYDYDLLQEEPGYELLKAKLKELCSILEPDKIYKGLFVAYIFDESLLGTEGEVKAKTFSMGENRFLAREIDLDNLAVRIYDEIYAIIAKYSEFGGREGDIHLKVYYREWILSLEDYMNKKDIVKSINESLKPKKEGDISHLQLMNSIRLPVVNLLKFKKVTELKKLDGEKFLKLKEREDYKHIQDFYVHPIFNLILGVEGNTKIEYTNHLNEKIMVEGYKVSLLYKDFTLINEFNEFISQIE